MIITPRNLSRAQAEGFRTVDTEVVSVLLLDPSTGLPDQRIADFVEGRKSERSKEDEGCTAVVGIGKGSGNTRRVNEERIERIVVVVEEEVRRIAAEESRTSSCKGFASTRERLEVEAFLLL